MKPIPINLLISPLQMFKRKQEDPHQESQEEKNDQLRSLLVTIMSLSLRYWNQTLQKSKVELAEESKLWNVYIDSNGTLRTQTLDRYFNIATLPKNPRWRNVLQTAYYVLQFCPNSAPKIKTELESKLTVLESYLQTRS